MLQLSFVARANAEQANLTPIAHATIKTEYFDIATTEYRLDGGQMRAGGALLVDGKSLIFASADGEFSRIDPYTWTYQSRSLPSLEDMGSAAIKNSKRYTYRELLPRVHGLAFANDSFYVAYDEYRAREDQIYFAISELKRSAKHWREIYRSPGLDVSYYALGGGGAMLAMPAENRLYFSVGDYSLDRINHLPSDVAPQNPTLPFGKVNYIDLADYSSHLFTSGHRNQLGLAILSDGRILESENGPRGGDELNILKQGQNYGWPYESYGTLYTSFAPYSDNLVAAPDRTYAQPLYVFTPSIAPTQLAQVEHFDPKWDGNVLLGSLAAESLYNIKIDGERVVYCEPIRIGARIRDLKQFDHVVVLLTDNGTLIEVKKTEGSTPFVLPK